MPDFTYTARNVKGDKVNGIIAAASERDALNLLAGQSLFPLNVNAKKEGGLGISFGGRVRGQLMAVTYGQMAALLNSGVPLLRALRVLRDQSSNNRLKTVLADVHDRVEDGATLADAMLRHPKVFNEMAINMVRAGGEGGFLEEALERVSKFTEQYEDLKSHTIGAMAYPTILAIVGITVVSILIVFFVPMFASLFESLREKGELPAMTDWLLWFSDTLRNYGLYIVAFLVIAAILIRARLVTPEGRRLADLLKIKLPIVGGIFQNLAVARFCRVLGTLLRNGVPILKSLEISRDAAGNKVLSEAIEEASENISSGDSLSGPLGSSGHFPATVVEMIAVAEESNTLDTVLIDIADGLETRTARRLDLAVRMLEPLMLLCLAGVVLCVVIALLIPVIKMSSVI